MTKIERVLAGEAVSPPPIWLMRQAGRYLPEYRSLRAKAASFLDLCYTPSMACEVTLQPIRRFDFDAAILFSDILVVPDALGQTVRFEEGIGPLLDPIDLDRVEDLTRQGLTGRLAPVLETVSQVREGLDGGKALIGFCGAPWTVATYMVGGSGGKDQMPARLAAYGNETGFARLIEILEGASIDYLVAQLGAGADVVQIFDSWAGVLDREGFERHCVGPIGRIVAGVRKAVPGAKVIGFARGIGSRIGRFASGTDVDCVGADWGVDLADMTVGSGKAIQGNLDPARLVTGGAGLERGVAGILEAMEGRAHIFNLGHGIVPETPIGHVEALVRSVRGR